MTTVVDLKELYKLIPETRPLESINFSNLKNLLTSVIEKVELSGKWEFVQYISSNPSLFVVRQKEVKKTEEIQYGPFNSLQDVDNPDEYKSKVFVKPPVKKEYDPVKMETAMETAETTKKVKETSDHLTMAQSSTLFVETKLPW